MKGPVVLQSCTMSLEDHLASCNETSVMSPNSAHDVSIKVEENIDVDTTEQKIPVPISFPPIKAEQDEVSYMSLRPFLDTTHQYPKMPAVLCCHHLPVCPSAPLWCMKICERKSILWGRKQTLLSVPSNAVISL